MVDKPSGQKSGINILSGNARTSGGTQSAVRSWAAPVTDNGLGDLARGLGQVGQGATQLAAAYRKRKDEQDELDILARAQGYSASVPLLEQQVTTELDEQNLSPEEYQQAYTNRFNELNKDLETTWAPEDSQKQQKWRLRVQPNYAAANLRMVEKGYKRSIVAQTANTLRTIESAKEATAKVAATGNLAQTLVAVGRDIQRTKQVTENLTDVGKALQLQDNQVQAAGQYILTAAQMKVLKADNPELAVADVEKMVSSPEVTKLFANNQSAYRTLQKSLRSVLDSATKEKQRLIQLEVGQKVDTAWAAATSVDIPGAPVQYTDTELAAMTPADRSKAQVQPALFAVEEQLNNTFIIADDAEYAQIKASARAAVNNLPAELRATYITGLEQLFTSADANRGKNAIARERAAGASSDTIATNTLRRSNNNPTAAFEELNGSDVDAALSQLETSLRSGTPNRGLLITQTVEELSDTAVGIPGYNKREMLLSQMYGKAGSAGLKRAIAVAALIPTAANEPIQATQLMDAAYGGVSSQLQRERGLEPTDVEAIKRTIASHPTYAQLTEEVRANLQGANSREMVSALADTALAVVLSRPSIQGSKAAEAAAEATIKYLGDLTGVTSTGERVTNLNIDNIGSRFAATSLRLPDSQRAKWQTPAYRNDAAKFINNKLLEALAGKQLVGFSDPERFRTKRLRMVMTSGGEGIGLHYADELSDRPVMVMGRGNVPRPLVMTFSEIDAGVSQVRNTATAKPALTLDKLIRPLENLGDSAAQASRGQLGGGFTQGGLGN